MNCASARGWGDGRAIGAKLGGAFGQGLGARVEHAKAEVAQLRLAFENGRHVGCGGGQLGGRQAFG
jgi:hypothetical protein